MSNLRDLIECYFCEKKVIIMNMRHWYQPRIKNHIPDWHICINCCQLLDIKIDPFSYKIYPPQTLKFKSFQELKIYLIKKKENQNNG